MILYDPLLGRRVTSTGVISKDEIRIGYQDAPTFEIQFVTANPAANTVTPIDVSAATAWKAAVDKDFSHATTPMCRTLDADIDKTDVATGILSVKLDANTATFQSALGSNEKIPAFFELQGINADTEIIYTARFSLVATNSIDPAGGTPPTPSSDYYSKTQVDALFQAGYEVEFSIDGSTLWHETQSLANDKFYRYRNADLTGNWSDAIGLIQGTTGTAATVEAGAVTTLAAGASATVTNTGTSSAAVFAFGIPQGIQGIQGDAGPSAYQVWLDEDNTGTVADYLNSLKGDDGTGLNIRGAYSAEDTYTSSATVRDAVQDQGCLWGCIVETTIGNAPPTYPTVSNTQWVLLVAKGDTGATGAPGATGAAGADGVDGADGEFTNGVPDFEFVDADLTNGVLVRTFAQLGVVAAVPVQVYDNSGVLITDDSAVVLSWTGTGISVDVSAVDPITGTWLLRFAGGTKQIVRDFEMTTLQGAYTPDFADGDFQRGTLTGDMTLSAPSTIEASGLAMCLEITCSNYVLTVGSNTYTGKTVLVTYYRSGASVRTQVAEVTV